MEHRAIKSLKNNGNIVNLPADKGNSIVLVNGTDYVAECERKLNDNSTYQELEEDLTTEFNEKIKEFLHSFGPAEDLSIQSIELLSPRTSKAIKVYTLPKIHKPLRPPPLLTH